MHEDDLSYASPPIAQAPQPSNESERRLLVIALQSIALIVWGLHLYVRTLPPTPTPIPAPGSAEAAWWGLWPITYAPAWSIWLGTLALLAFIGWWWLRGRRQPILFTATRLSPIYYVLAGALTLGFFAFPIAHTRWGDAYMLANGIAWPDAALRLTHSWQAPLDVRLHAQLWQLLAEGRGWADAMPAYRLLSPLAGVLYLATVLALAARRSLAPAWVTFGLLTSLGLIQLFFGYVENYSFAAAGVLAYLWLGLGVLDGKRPLWLAAGVLAVTNATHPSTVILAPSLLYLGWRLWRHGVPTQEPNRLSPWSAGWQIGGPMALVAGATVLMMESGGHGVVALFTSDRPGGGDARWFVPLWETQTRWEQYTMFSWPHLRDVLNEQLLVGPVVLPALLILAATRRQLTIDHDQLSIVNFLRIATVFYLLFIFVWNPDYGGQRDWDLFSLALLPPTLLLVIRLPQALGRGNALLGGVAPLILVQAMHTAAWVYQNTRPWEWP